jgi:acetyl-CoA carboxylase alpha subunit
MSEEEELRAQIIEVKASIDEMKAVSKKNETDLKKQVESLSKEKSELIAGIKARMELIAMLKRDIMRMAYEQELKVTDEERAKTPQKTK